MQRRVTAVPRLEQKMCSKGVLPQTPVHEDGGRDHNAALEHLVLCDTGCNRSWSRCTRSWSRCTRCCEVIRTGERAYAAQIRVIQADENPSAWRSGTWIPSKCFELDGERARLHPWADLQGVHTHDQCEGAANVLIHYCRREGECTRYQKFRDVEVSGVAMVPNGNKHTP